MQERNFAKKQRRKARVELKHLLLRDPTGKEFIDYMEKRQKVEKELEHDLHREPTEHEVVKIMEQKHKAMIEAPWRMAGGSSSAEKALIRCPHCSFELSC